jgi:thiol:disulfide interchange protein DsbC
MKKLLKTALLLVGMVPLGACSANADTANPSKVKQAFEENFPNRKVESVTATPVKGIYEVVLPGRQIFYTDAKADYLFMGANLVDVKARKSLTEARMQSLSKVDWKALPLELAVKEVRGNGARQIAVFSDPDCPYCKQLERESLAKLDNVTIHTFLYPLTQLHPDAMRKSKLVWCSSNRIAAWTDWMRDGKALSGSESCDTAALEKIQALGDKYGINGTPALVFPNGRMVAGALPKEQIESLLGAK